MNQIRVTPLGGLKAIGAMNCMLYQSSLSTILVDCGVQFPDDRHPGVEAILPDFDVLEGMRDRLTALVLTHGHEDHVGGVPYFLQQFPIPVYGTDFTLEIISNKLKEFNIKGIELRPLSYGTIHQVGDFQIEPVFVNHSMMDVAALYMKADDLSLFHCTDFKIDHSSVDGRTTDLKRMKEIGDAGLDLLLSDSTNAPRKGWTVSEGTVRNGIVNSFTEIKGRIIACLFSSNTFRIQSLIEAARLSGRKIALTGRGTKEYFAIARLLNRIDTAGVPVLDVEEITEYPDDQILVVATGSQAEPRSVLSRMSKNMFRPFKIKPGDTILMSSKMIPGNEGPVISQMNRLAELGAKIITDTREQPIHASGHAKEDELREVLRLTKPRTFIPIHGDYIAMQRHMELGIEEGVHPKDTMIALNGDVVGLDVSGIRLVDQIHVGELMVSENLGYLITPEAVRRRNKMAWNGMIFISLIFDHNRSEFIKPIQVHTEGLFGGETEANLREQLVEHLERFVDREHLNPNDVAKAIKTETRRYYKGVYHLRPEVSVIIHDI